jgi:hypothetical protein
MLTAAKPFSVFVNSSKLSLATRHDLTLGYAEAPEGERPALVGKVVVTELATNERSDLLRLYRSEYRDKLQVSVGVLAGMLLGSTGKLVSVTATAEFASDKSEEETAKHFVGTFELSGIDFIT